EFYINYDEEDIDWKDTTLIQDKCTSQTYSREFPEELSNTQQVFMKEEIECNYSATEISDGNQSPGHDRVWYKHQEDVPEYVVEDENMILTNCKMIQENPKFKVLVLNSSARSDNDNKAAQKLMLDVPNNDRKQTAICNSEKFNNSNHSSLFNLSIIPTLIPSSNNVAQQQCRSRSLLKRSTQGEDSLERLLDNNYYETCNNKDRKPKYVKTLNGKLIDYSSPAMQPVVCLQKSPLLSDINNKDTCSSKDNCIVEEISVDSETALKELESNVVKERSNIKNNKIQFRNQEMNISQTVQVENLENIKKDKSKIIENIENIIKRNEALLLETAAKKVEKPLSATKKNGKELQIIKKPKVFNCRFCKKKFNSGIDLKEHAQNEHTAIKCQHCELTFFGAKMYKQHSKSHTNLIDYICEFCGLTYKLKELKIHLRSHRSKKYKFKCKECGKIFGSKEMHSSHIKTHQKTIHLCESCGKCFKFLNSMKAHQKSCMGIKPLKLFKCPHCQKEYRSRRSFKEHIRIHTNERPYKCKLCEETFRKRIQLVTHTLKHSNARPHKYSCNICDLKFRHVKDLNEHQETHEGEEVKNVSNEKNPNFVCPTCGKTYLTMNTFNIHQLTHSREKSFLCEMCGKYFLTKGILNSHLLIHTDDKPFICERCGRGFRSKANLLIHSYIHNDKKYFPCRHCDKKCFTKHIRVIHERTHTGERPFNCCLCPKSFHSKANLTVHLQSHSEERPFLCKYCPKSFKRRDALNTHIRVHTNERPYVCKLCNRGFKQNGDCRKHELTHNVDC
ncbi:hypothetical protein C0J52_09205, partial [Blattella germanica]